MRTRIWNRWAIVLASAIVLAGPAVSVRGGSEEDQESVRGVFKVTVIPNEAAADIGVRPFEDRIMFAGGLFTAEQFGMYGFAPDVYEVTGSAPPTFTATQISEKHGTTVWTGRMVSGGINGELVWTKKSGTVVQYTWTGTWVRDTDEVEVVEDE